MPYNPEMEKDAAKAFIQSTNFMAFHSKPFAEEIVYSTHRTSQQAAFKLFMACVKEWAKQDRYDARNEATIKLSKQIVEALGDEIDMIPFI
jgi:hypothetical protein